MRKMSPDEMIFRVCNFLRRLMWFCARYPSFSSDFIEEKINRPQTKRHELLAYRENCTTSSKRKSLALITIYTAYLMKQLYAAYESHRLYDYQNFKQNIRRLNSSSQHLKSISSCLVTNCTHLAPTNSSGWFSRWREPEKSGSGNESLRALEQLGKEASELPIFSLCHPQIDSLYTPITKLDSFGILFLALTTYTIALLGIWTIAQQMVLPAGNDLLMTIVAPRVTFQVVRERAREFLLDFAASYRNFIRVSPYCCSGSQLDLHNFIQPFGQLLQSDTDQRPNLSESLFSAHRSASEKESELYVENMLLKDCLPITRSKWWRSKLAKMFFITVCVTNWNFIIIFTFCLNELSSRSSEKERRWAVYGLEMERQDCFIWQLESGGLRNEPIKLSSIEANFNWYTWLEVIILNFAPDFTICLLISHYWCLLCEASIRLAELRHSLVITLLVARIHNLSHADEYQHVDPSACELNVGGQVLNELQESTQDLYTEAKLKRLFRDSVLTFAGYFCLRHRKLTGNQLAFQYKSISCKSNDLRQEETFLDEVHTSLKLKRRQSMCRYKHEFNLETLEHIYVNFRLYVDYIHSLRPSVAIAFAIIFSLNYGYVLIAVICRRKMASMSLEQTSFVIVFAWLLANFFIFMSANAVHANAKKLNPLLWSIIAQLSHWPSPRARHLRALWLRQVILLDNEGGLALRALGMRVTYVYILRLMIWTATIFVMALKEN